jgi:hypothetical protein
MAGAVLIGAPVYRASYPGILKNLLDITPVEALQNKPVGIVAMGGSPHHYLAVDTQLRQVLAWFGALVAPTSVYITGGDFRDGRLASDSARADLAALTDTLTTLGCRAAIDTGAVAWNTARRWVTSRVPTRLPAGGSRIRTDGPAREGLHFETASCHYDGFIFPKSLRPLATGTEGSNLLSSSGESRANLSSSECRRDGRPRHGLRDPYEEDARADRGDEGDLDQGQAGTSRRVRQLSADDDLAQAVAEAASADNRRRRLPPRRAARDPLWRRDTPGAARHGFAR